MRFALIPVGQRSPFSAGLAIASCALVIAGCGATEAGRPARALPQGVAVQVAVSDLAFDPHGKLLALDEGKISTVDAAGQMANQRAVVPADDVDAGAALAPDGKRAALFVHAGRSRIRAVELTDRAIVWSADAGSSQYDERRVHWSADGSRLLVETDGPLRLHDASDGRLVRSFRHGTLDLGRQPLSPKGSTLAMPAQGGVALVSAHTGRRRVIRLGASLDRPTWSPDGRSIAGGGAGAVVVNVASGRIRRLNVDSGRELAWSPDGRWLAAYGTASNDHGAVGVSIIDVRTGQATMIARTGAREERGQLTWSPDSRRLAYLSPPGIPCAPEAGGGTC